MVAVVVKDGSAKCSKANGPAPAVVMPLQNCRLNRGILQILSARTASRKLVNLLKIATCFVTEPLHLVVV